MCRSALKEIHTATHPARLDAARAARAAQRIEDAKPSRLLRRVYGKKEVDELNVNDTQAENDGQSESEER